MIESKDFDALHVEKSNTEFVVVARGINGFVPVIISENCGLDLMGFVASRGYIPNEQRRLEQLEIYAISSDIEEYHEAEIEIDDGQNSSVYFYWKGAMPNEMEEFLHVCKTSLRQLFRERDIWKKSTQAFFSWHLGPIIFLIERENGYQAIKKRRAKRTNKRIEFAATIFAFVGLVMFALLALGGDYLNLFDASVLPSE